MIKYVYEWYSDKKGYGEEFVGDTLEEVVARRDIDMRYWTPDERRALTECTVYEIDIPEEDYAKYENDELNTPMSEYWVMDSIIVREIYHRGYNSNLEIAIFDADTVRGEFYADDMVDFSYEENFSDIVETLNTALDSYALAPLNDIEIKKLDEAIGTWVSAYSK